MPKTPQQARHRGLRAALATTGDRIRAAVPTHLIVTSVTLLGTLAASGCLPKWGPPAPPPFPREGDA